MHAIKGRHPGPVSTNLAIGEDNTSIALSPCGAIQNTAYDCDGPVFKPPLVRTPYTLGPLYNPSEFKPDSTITTVKKGGTSN